MIMSIIAYIVLSISIVLWVACAIYLYKNRTARTASKEDESNSQANVYNYKQKQIVINKMIDLDYQREMMNEIAYIISDKLH